MLIIYTRPNNIFKKEYLKHLISKITGKVRGPKAVIESMKRGLDKLNVPYSINPSYNSIKQHDTVHVVSGIQTLSECLLKKREGVIKKLIVGPSIVVVPKEADSILLNEDIDAILIPSEWTQKLYAHLSPEISKKIFIWFSGVGEPIEGSRPKNEYKDFDYLIYNKNLDSPLSNDIKEILKNRKRSFTELVYGNFRQVDFFQELNRCKTMIYLSPSESQGIALHEAWIRDVPTLVWDRKYWEYKDITWGHEKISCPYLTDELGLTFSTTDDFESVLLQFEERHARFKPREYSLEHFTDVHSVKRLLSIIKSIS